MSDFVDKEITYKYPVPFTGNEDWIGGMHVKTLQIDNLVYHLFLMR